ncbi:acylphosphatase [Lysinibacillus sp. 54212]|uniref:acylphosphatase n=1 Tax=Lysinibacillus sp. 54212 TaxID=3119829 RepID=UPI002FCC3900
MGILSKLRDDYVIWHANRITIPPFAPSRVVRKQLIFSGRVQMVGFRLELYRIAQRLELTGWVKNLENGDVEAEIQGEEMKIVFLIDSMKSLKRAAVKNVQIIERTNVEGDSVFTIVK